MNTRMMFTFLTKDCPLFSRALVAPWRLCFLVAGLALLCVGSHITPSTDWDYPISFIMGICALEGSVKILTILASVDEGSVKILTVLATVDEGSIKILTVLATVVEGSVKILTVLATVVEGSVKILTVLSTKVEGCLMLPMWKCCQ